MGLSTDEVSAKAGESKTSTVDLKEMFLRFSMESSTVGVDLQPKIIAQEHARDVAASTLGLKQWTRIFMN